jgi:Protein of unknown function (DUF4239)
VIYEWTLDGPGKRVHIENGTLSTFWSLGTVIEDAVDGRLVVQSSDPLVGLGYLCGHLPYCCLRLSGRGSARGGCPSRSCVQGVLAWNAVTVFGLLVGFVAVPAWNDFDEAKVAVATEYSALRLLVLLDESLPDEQRIHLGTLINRHIDEAANQEWPAMAQHRLTLASSPTSLLEALQLTLLMKPQDESQRRTQGEMVAALNTALDAWHRRISISQSGVGPIEWAAILLPGLCMLIAIAIVHSDNRSLVP